MPGDPDARDGEDRGWAPLDPAAEPRPAPPPAAGVPGAVPPPPSAPPGAVPPPPGGTWPPPPGYGWPQPPQAGGWGVGPAQLNKAGDVRTGPLPMHPMGVGDVLDGAFKLLKANAKTIFIVVAVIVLPVQFLAAFAARHTFSVGLVRVMSDPTVANSVNNEPSNLQLGVQIVSGLVGLVVTPFIAGAISRIVADSYVGRTTTAGAALRVAGRRFWALFASFVLVHLVEVVGFAMCILPGIAVSALYVLVAPAIAVEEIGPLKAMGRSWSLVRPRFWHVLGISILAGIMASMIGQVLGTLPTLAGVLVGGTYAWIAVGLGGVLTRLVATPIVAIVATLLYFDARIRQEGFDLDVMASDLSRAAVA